MSGTGVVHVGAHMGEEVPTYLAEGRTPILCFEPQSLGWYPPPGVRLVPIALGDKTSALVLHIPQHLHSALENDTQSATGLYLIPKRAREIGWTPTPYSTLLVDVSRFDEWANAEIFDPDLYSLLVIDVQGMESHVLRGFGRYLDGFDELVIECSKESIYLGGAPLREVVTFLAEHSFRQITPDVAHGDVGFRKE